MVGKAFGVGLLWLTIGLSSVAAQSNIQTKAQEYSSGLGQLNVWTTEDVVRQSTKASADEVKVSVGTHEGFDRLVFEFKGGLPNYCVGYEEPPIQIMSGEEVKGIRGRAFITVSMSPITYSEKNYNTPIERLKEGQNPLRTALVSDVWSLGWFEGEFNYAVGLKARKPFRVLVLSNPSRLVIDFKK